MARANLIISEYGSLNFDNEWRQNEQQYADYAQKVVVGDVVTVQYGVPQGLAQTWQRVDVAQYKVQDTGRNLVLKSNVPYSNTNYPTARYNLSEPLVGGETYTVQIKCTPSPTETSMWLVDPTASSGVALLVRATGGVNGIYSATQTVNPATIGAGTSIAVYFAPNSPISESSIEWIKIEKGNKATDWTPAPEDRQEVLPASPASAIDDYMYYNVAIDTTQLGCYIAAIEVTNNDGSITTIAKALFEVVSDLPGSILFRYQNVKNKDNTVFSAPFYFRCPAKFFPQNEEYNSEDNDFRDQEYDPSLLSSEAYTTYGLTVGGAQGVPTWIGRKLNNIVSCTDLYLGEIGNEVQFVKASGAKVERASLGEMNPLYQFSVNLEKVSDGILIGNYTPVDPEPEQPYSKILIRTEFYKVIADEVEFSVSPQSIEFNFDELTPEEIAVIAANNTWTVAAGDPSWCTVAKIADNKATITLTENTGTANRSQLITFTWTSPTTNVTTQRTVAITQYYEAIVANPVVFSGKVIDAETGAPVVISGNAGCRMYSFPPNSIGGGARMFNIETDTSGNFTQTANYDRVAWDNIGRFRAMFEVGDGLYVEQQVFEVTAPVYEDAMADGVSLGTLQLQRIPTAKIIIRTEFYNVEEETPAEPVYIFGVVKDYNTGAVIPAATVELLSDSTPIATVTADAQGRFYYEWDVDENTYNNMYGLYYTVRKSGYQDYPSVVYFSILPDYADASEANGGVNLGTIKMQKS